MNEMYNMTIVTHYYGVLAVFGVIFLNLYKLKQANKLVRQQGYKPSHVFLKGVHAMAIQPGPQKVFVPKAVKFRRSDHPFTKYYPVIDVNSAMSIRNHMQRYDALDEDYKIYLPASMTIKD